MANLKKAHEDIKRTLRITDKTDLINTTVLSALACLVDEIANLREGVMYLCDNMFKEDYDLCNVLPENQVKEFEQKVAEIHNKMKAKKAVDL